MRLLEAIALLADEDGRYFMTEVTEYMGIADTTAYFWLRQLQAKISPWPYTITRVMRDHAHDHEIIAKVNTEYAANQRRIRLAFAIIGAWKAEKANTPRGSHWEVIARQIEVEGGLQPGDPPFTREELKQLTRIDPGPPLSRKPKRSPIDRLRRVWKHPDPWKRIALIWGITNEARRNMHACSQAKRE